MKLTKWIVTGRGSLVKEFGDVKTSETDYEKVRTACGRGIGEKWSTLRELTMVI